MLTRIQTDNNQKFRGASGGYTPFIGALELEITTSGRNINIRALKQQGYVKWDWRFKPAAKVKIMTIATSVSSSSTGVEGRPSRIITGWGPEDSEIESDVLTVKASDNNTCPNVYVTYEVTGKNVLYGGTYQTVTSKIVKFNLAPSINAAITRGDLTLSPIVVAPKVISSSAVYNVSTKKIDINITTDQECKCSYVASTSYSANSSWRQLTSTYSKTSTASIAPPVKDASFFQYYWVRVENEQGLASVVRLECSISVPKLLSKSVTSKVTYSTTGAVTRKVAVAFQLDIACKVQLYREVNGIQYSLGSEFVYISGKHVAEFNITAPETGNVLIKAWYQSDPKLVATLGSFDVSNVSGVDVHVGTVSLEKIPVTYCCDSTDIEFCWWSIPGEPADEQKPVDRNYIVQHILDCKSGKVKDEYFHVTIPEKVTQFDNTYSEMRVDYIKTGKKARLGIIAAYRKSSGAVSAEYIWLDNRALEGSITNINSYYELNKSEGDPQINPKMDITFTTNLPAKLRNKDLPELRNTLSGRAVKNDVYKFRLNRASTSERYDYPRENFSIEITAPFNQKTEAGEVQIGGKVYAPFVYSGGKWIAVVPYICDNSTWQLYGEVNR